MPSVDKWIGCALVPTPRFGHGGVLYQGQLFCMGGEGFRRLFGQVEGYDLKTDRWMSYDTMRTPRHGMAPRPSVAPLMSRSAVR